MSSPAEMFIRITAQVNGAIRPIQALTAQIEKLNKAGAATREAGTQMTALGAGEADMGAAAGCGVEGNRRCDEGRGRNPSHDDGVRSQSSGRRTSRASCQNAQDGQERLASDWHIAGYAQRLCLQREDDDAERCASERRRSGIGETRDRYDTGFRGGAGCASRREPHAGDGD